MKYKLKNNEVIEVRIAVVEDAKEILEYMNTIGFESEYLSFGPEGPGITIDQQIQQISSLEGKISFLIVGRIKNKIVSTAGINVREDRVRLRHFGILGISVLKKDWGKGIGNIMLATCIEEAKIKGIKKINLEVRTDNKKAIQLYEKFGFKIEGTIEKNTLIDSKYYDCHLMGVII